MLTLVALALCVNVALGAYCHGSPDPNAQMNKNPIYTDPPVYIKSVPFAHLYELNTGINMIPIVHVYGTPEQMGYGHGLIRPDGKDFIDAVYQWLDDSAFNSTGHYPDWMPRWFYDAIINLGLNAALNLELEATKNFTPQYFFDELYGLSRSTGLTQKKLEWVHLIGELTKGSCSMYGAWGDAIPKDYASLLQLRALDWEMDAPFRDYPQITVYHPKDGQPFANVGYTGFIGSFSGMSAVPMGTSEIGVSYPDDTFGEESRKGIPFTYLLRDLLQFDGSLQDSIDRITDANRTCNLILGVGDGNTKGGFRGVQYSYSVANFYDDTNMQPDADWHPKIPDTVYYAMDWNCPNFDQVMARQLNALYGNITVENSILNITSIVQSGDNFATYYDLTPSHPTMWVAFASARDAPGPAEAYNRQFSRIDMNELFAVPAPTEAQIEATKHVMWKMDRSGKTTSTA